MPTWRVGLVRAVAGVLGVLGTIVGVGVGARLARPDPHTLERRAEQAARDGRWDEAASTWARLNDTAAATARTQLAEARAHLRRNRARDAEAAIERATRAEPSRAEPWRLWLELLRLEDRPAQAIEVGDRALAAVEAADRRDVLKALTLALLADPPDDVALPTLRAWAAADPDDLDAQLAYLARQVLAGPRQSGPIAARSARVATLDSMFRRHPEHPGVRAAKVAALGESGDVESGRAILAAWPESERDLAYQRLAGRWALDFDDRPADAEAAYRRVLEALPYDWKTRTRLARALHAQGRAADASREADVVARHREALDPARLGPRLTADLDRLDDPAALIDLATLCESVGLGEIGAAWRVEAQRVRSARATLR